MAADDARTLVAAALGYCLEAMDFLFFTLVISLIIPALHANLGEVGLISSASLIASAAGGYLFGWLTDYLGRSRVLMITVLVFSVGSLGAASSQSWQQLLAWRVLLGLGMGGEWGGGMALLLEKKWGSRNRGKASGTVQSMWPLGYLIATGISVGVVPAFGWRGLFVVGIAPALLSFWVQRSVPEPERWRTVRRSERIRPQEIFTRQLIRPTILLMALSITGLWAYESFAIFLPTYLQGKPALGGLAMHFSSAIGYLILFNAVGVVVYIGFGFLSDAWSRKGASITFAIVCIPFGFLLALSHGREPALGIGIAGVGAFTAYFAIYGVWITESFPTRVRGWALGLIFNSGRLVGGFAPVVIGSLAAGIGGLGPAMLIGIPGFALFAVAASMMRETRHIRLESLDEELAPGAAPSPQSAA